MLKQTVSLFVAVLMAVATAGCAKKNNVDTGKLESSFRAAEPAAKSDADKAVAAVKAGNYSEALADLQRLASKAKLTPEQQEAVKDLIAQVQKAMADAAGKAAAEAQKTGEDLKKSLPGTR